MTGLRINSLLFKTRRKSINLRHFRKTAKKGFFEALNFRVGILRILMFRVIQMTSFEIHVSGIPNSCVKCVIIYIRELRGSPVNSDLFYLANFNPLKNHHTCAKRNK